MVRIKEQKQTQNLFEWTLCTLLRKIAAAPTHRLHREFARAASWNNFTTSEIHDNLDCLQVYNVLYSKEKSIPIMPHGTRELETQYQSVKDKLGNLKNSEFHNHGRSYPPLKDNVPTVDVLEARAKELIRRALERGSDRESLERPVGEYQKHREERFREELNYDLLHFAIMRDHLHPKYYLAAFFEANKPHNQQAIVINGALDEKGGFSHEYLTRKMFKSLAKLNDFGEFVTAVETAGSWVGLRHSKDVDHQLFDMEFLNADFLKLGYTDKESFEAIQETLEKSKVMSFRVAHIEPPSWKIELPAPRSTRALDELAYTRNEEAEQGSMGFNIREILEGEGDPAL